MENQSLILDLVAWIDERPRTYGDVMDAWRTSCPRLTIWEDCLDQGFLRIVDGMVHTTPAGCRFLSEQSSVEVC